MTTITAVRLLGAAELAALLNVSRGRVTQLAAKPWFPAPVARLKMGAVWELADIERMAAQTGRTLNYDSLNDGPASSSPGGSSSGTAETVMQKGALPALPADGQSVE
jgi:hypothetical protein